MLLKNKQNSTKEAFAKILTKQQAFDAMIYFLESYCYKTQSNQIYSLLNDLDMKTWEDGNLTADPVLWGNWIECTNKKNELTIQEAYQAVVTFVSMRYSTQPDEHVVNLVKSTQLKNVRLTKKRLQVINNLWSYWLLSVERVVKK